MVIWKLPQKAASEVFRSESDASSIGAADIETLPHLPLADCPQGLSGAFPKQTVFHMKRRGNLGKHFFLSPQGELLQLLPE